MPRPMRIDYPDAFHHVMNRAGAKRWPFVGEEHCRLFLKALEDSVLKNRIEVHAYCLMSNHFHLLLRSPLANVSKSWCQTPLSVQFIRVFSFLLFLVSDTTFRSIYSRFFFSSWSWFLVSDTIFRSIYSRFFFSSFLGSWCQTPLSVQFIRVFSFLLGLGVRQALLHGSYLGLVTNSDLAPNIRTPC
jgi:REP element-mobilizing transposase RayT